MRPIRTIGLNENPAVFIHEFSLIDQKAIPFLLLNGNGSLYLTFIIDCMHLKQLGLMFMLHLGDDESSFSYGKWYVKNWLTDQLGKLQDSVVAIASKPRLFQTDPFHEQLKVIVRTFTLEHTGLI